MKKNIIIGILILMIFWYAITVTGLVDSFFVPGPAAVFTRLYELLSGSDFRMDIITTLYRVAVSFASAVLIGVPLGLLFGLWEGLYRRIEFIIDFFRSIPPTAMFPLFLLFFGISDLSRLAVTVFACSLIIIFNTSYGVINTDKTRHLIARSMGANTWQILREVTIWESLPGIIVGVRNALSMALIVIVVTEMFIGSSHGLGRKIIDSELIYDIPAMYAALLMVGVLGYVSNLSFALFENKLLHWARNLGVE